MTHLIQSRGNGFDTAAEAIDHVGFKLKDYVAFKIKLEKLDIPFSLMELPEINERHIFFRMPTGPLIEVVFDAACFNNGVIDNY